LKGAPDMGRRKKNVDLRVLEYSLHIQIQTKKKKLQLLINQLKDIKSRIADEKEVLRDLVVEHKEVRTMQKEEEGYQW
jgi:hypothetical protein